MQKELLLAEAPIAAKFCCYSRSSCAIDLADALAAGGVQYIAMQACCLELPNVRRAILVHCGPGEGAIGDSDTGCSFWLPQRLAADAVKGHERWCTAAVELLWLRSALHRVRERS